jgi:hypothetical protein
MENARARQGRCAMEGSEDPRSMAGQMGEARQGRWKKQGRANARRKANARSKANARGKGK